VAVAVAVVAVVAVVAAVAVVAVDAVLGGEPADEAGCRLALPDPPQDASTSAARRTTVKRIR